MNGIGAAQAIQTWLTAFERSASGVTRSTLEPDSSAESNDSLLDGMVGLHTAANGVHAAIQVFKAQDEMIGSVIDMLA